MPTPVSVARQCLTEEAAGALDDAVAVARRRGHAQTTSLHAVSALLALPSSSLREACARSRSSVYSTRLQFRALELSVGVSLDRLPTAKRAEEPPVSNSLMAAIKRSQANQRRHPDTFHLYQQVQHQQSQASISCVKVELKHFLLSILDDPIVSRVFGEAGFRSCEIKFAILQPPPISRFPGSFSRCPPLFLGNLPDSDPNRAGFNFPFAGFPGSDNRDENCRRIGEVLVKKKGKNPLLIGVCANDALSSFKDCVQTEKIGVLPTEIDGLGLISVDKEISEFVSKIGNKEMVDLKFKEVTDLVGNCSGPGFVVNVGDLKVLFVDGDLVDNINYVVSQLSGLLELHGGKLWLTGALESYDTYKKILAQFPSLEKDWDLQLFPITSSKPSLMGSFVPLGGFFPTPSEFKNLLSSTNQSTLCNFCNEKYDQEVSLLLKGGSNTSVAYQYSASLPSWLRTAECDSSKRVDAVKSKDDGTVLNAKLTGLGRKWNDICQRLHPITPFCSDISQSSSQIQHVEGFQFVADRKRRSSKDSSSNGSGSSNLISSTPLELPKVSPSKQTMVSRVASEAEITHLQPRLSVEASKSCQLGMDTPWPPTYPVHSLRLQPDLASPSSVTSVTTDLGLGTLYAVPGRETGKLKIEDHKNRLHYLSGSVTAEFDGVSENASNHIASPLSCSIPELGGQVDPKDFKTLWRVLTENVSWQGKATCTVSETISRCRTGHGRLRGSNHRRDIWLCFLGHDKVGKTRTAAALAEIMFGTRESLISVDLSPEYGISCSTSIFDSRDISSYDVKFRGKTVVDYIAEELSRKPKSVVLLENVDKADFVSQSSLSQAIRTGKFRDSHGREIGISNAIFVTTSNTTNKENFSGKERVEFSEVRILGAKRWQMQVSVGCVGGDFTKTNGMNVSLVANKESSKLISGNKRKMIDMNDSAEQDNTSETPKRAHKASSSFLDLNLPVEEEDDDYRNCNSDSNSENSDVWLEDFFSQVDAKVVFEPFDFDALAEELLKEINRSFQKTVGPDITLQIEEEVMVEMLAAAWLSDRKRAVEEWVERVLGKSFAEAQQRYQLTAQSVVKLVTCEGLFVEEQAYGVCLPARIILN
ncbi:Protein SMAX1-LIKE like [Actinidia chinensis var. chinensis]|uniref:Protein SMAX1-LIKE like n=1 Tax=Actinidia chinensis var. chinensis TaxID=1590841 RepID=A0A2R6PPR8_ACTCC|nr:Protein SMAX1-LIKE like [Actinidia chinensis var. chinensis]